MGRRSGRLAWAAAVLWLTVGAPATASAAEGHALGVQAGWFSAELEYRAPFGLFVDVGVPWFALFLESTTSGVEWYAAFEGKLGYQLPLSESWSLRFGVRDAESVGHGCPCLDGEEVTDWKSLISFEAGARFEADCGFVVGADLSVYSLWVHDSGHITHYWPGYSVLFSQAYIGYRWML
jgi:hypothetical protein